MGMSVKHGWDFRCFENSFQMKVRMTFKCYRAEGILHSHNYIIITISIPVDTVTTAITTKGTDYLITIANLSLLLPSWWCWYYCYSFRSTRKPSLLIYLSVSKMEERKPSTRQCRTHCIQITDESVMAGALYWIAPLDQIRFLNHSQSIWRSLKVWLC